MRSSRGGGGSRTRAGRRWPATAASPRRNPAAPSAHRPGHRAAPAWPALKSSTSSPARSTRRTGSRLRVHDGPAISEEARSRPGTASPPSAPASCETTKTMTWSSAADHRVVVGHDDLYRHLETGSSVNVLARCGFGRCCARWRDGGALDHRQLLDAAADHLGGLASPCTTSSSASAAPRRRLCTAATSPRRTWASSVPMEVWAGEMAMSIWPPCTRSA
jgi:hypothetical protein